MRTMLILGARSVCFTAKRNQDKTDPLHCKARRIAEHSELNIAVVAVANQMARISWVILTEGIRFAENIKRRIGKPNTTAVLTSEIEIAVD